LDVAQALAVSKLRESHAQMLIEAGEALDLVMPDVTIDAPMKGKHPQYCFTYRGNQSQLWLINPSIKILLRNCGKS